MNVSEMTIEWDVKQNNKINNTSKQIITTTTTLWVFMALSS